MRVKLQTNQDMMDELTAALAAGTPPDVARLKEYRLADLGARALGDLVDCTTPLEPTLEAAVRRIRPRSSVADERGALRRERIKRG